MKASSSSRSRCVQLPERRVTPVEAGQAGREFRALHGPSWARWAPALLWLSACTTGTIGEPSTLDPDVFGRKVDQAPTSSSTPSDPTAPKSPTSASTAGGQAPAPQACDGAQLGAAAPIARLTNREYRNTLRSLLPRLSLPAVNLPADVVVEGFDNNAKAQTPSAALIEQYGASAEAVSESVMAQLHDVLPCAQTADSDPDGCATQFVDSFVSRAYRRPLQAAERTRYLGLFQTANTEYGFPPAIGMLVQAALQSPHFLYRVESSTTGPLDGYALASRLSYFFWDDMPDEELLDAAASGALASTAGVETQARRMLTDPKARPAVASVFRQWLRFDKMERMPKSSELFPDWNDQVASSLRSGAERFVERVFWDMDGSLEALLTDTGSYVDQHTAPLYGLQGQLTGLTLMDTNAQQRSGILTQAGLLAAFAHETTDSPILRGVFVMDRLLCSAPPPPPPGVTGSIVETPQTTGMTLTTRDRVALTHESGECAACHRSIDGFGFGFSHYDALGRWRDTEFGLPVNAAGWIENTRDANGTFDGAVELGQRLANSAQVSECASAQWYRYALGLGAADVADCSLAPIAQAFANSDGSLKELMITIATSDAFRNAGGTQP